MSNDIQLGTFPPIDGGGHSTTHEEAAAGDITTRLGVPANDNASLDSKTLLKLLSCGFSFFYAGCNDGALGTLIPFLLTSYNINTSFIAIIYSVTFLGWLVAAFTNSHLTHALRLSMGATLALGAILQLLANVLRVWRPPFPLFCISFFFTYLGMGYQDSHSNTFTASVKSAHRWLGFIHASYAAGTATGPLLAAVIANHSRWNYFYLYTIGVGLVNLCLVLVAFHEPLLRASPSPAEAEVETARGNRKAVEDLKRTLQLRSVWLLSIFYFFFLGSVFTLSGWAVEFLVRVRHGELSQMAYVPTGFSGGGLLGRILLAEPTYRFGERRMVALYTIICLALQLVFWLEPNIIANVVVFSLMGFFFGPLFPTGISVASKLFPRELRSSALSFLFALSQAGGAIFPSLTGVLAAEKGVQVLQPMLVGLFGATFISWVLVPKVPKRQE